MKFSEVEKDTVFVIIAPDKKMPLFGKTRKGEICRIGVNLKTKVFTAQKSDIHIAPDKEVQVISFFSSEKTA
jgi:hypothetical protein